jgi:hypothetical protein
MHLNESDIVFPGKHPIRTQKVWRSRAFSCQGQVAFFAELFVSAKP